MPLFTRVDDLTRPDHSHLRADDECYYLREYHAGRGYDFGETNSIISNLKKKPSESHRPGYHYKAKDIGRVGLEMRGSIDAKWLNGACVVPMPPSKAKAHPEYDDRVVKIAKFVCNGTGGDLRELLVRTVSAESLHSTTARRDIQKLIRELTIDQTLVQPIPTRVAIIDDMVTTGASFRAAMHYLRSVFPAARIVGFFVARRIPLDADDDDDDFGP